MSKKYAGWSEDELRVELKAVAKDRNAVNELLEKALKDKDSAVKSFRLILFLSVISLLVDIASR